MLWRWTVIVVIWCSWWWLALNMALLWLIGDGWASQTANSSSGEQIGLSVLCVLTLGPAVLLTRRLLRPRRD